jgi:hypothetical protein
VVRPDKGIRIHDTLTRLEYKENNGAFLKRKVRLRARGDQQIEGESFKSSDLYAPTLKDPEARLLAAITEEHSCPLLKTDTRKAFLYGEMGVRRFKKDHPTGGRNRFPRGMFFCFSKACMARNRPHNDGIWASQNG